MIKKKLFKRCVALSMAMVLTVGAGSTGIIDAVATPATTESTEISEEEKVALEQAKANQAAAAQTIADVLQNVQAQESIVDGYQSTANAATELTDEVAALPQAAMDAETSAVNAKGASLEATYQTAIGGPEESVKAVAEANYNAINTSLANIGMMKNAIDTKVGELPKPTLAQESTSTDKVAPKLEETSSAQPTVEVSNNSGITYPSQSIAIKDVQAGAALEATIAVAPNAKDTTGKVFDVTLSGTSNATKEIESQTVLLLDISTSISNSEVEAMKAAAKSFINNIDDEDKVAVVTVADTVDGAKFSNAITVSDNKAELLKFVDGIKGSERAESTTTNMQVALKYADAILAGDGEINKNVVVFSDGGSTTGATENDIIKSLKEKATIFTVGYDEAIEVAANANYMKSLATAKENDGNAKSATSKTAVSDILNAIEANSQKKIDVTADSVEVVLADGFEVAETEKPSIELKADDYDLNFPENGTLDTTIVVQATEETKGEGLQVVESVEIKVGEETVDVQGVELATVTIETQPIATAIGARNLLRSTTEIPEEIFYKAEDITVAKITEADEYDYEGGRTYTINLSAESNLPLKKHNPLHVVILLDDSGSMTVSQDDYSDITTNAYRQLARVATNELINSIELAEAEFKGTEGFVESKVSVVSYAQSVSTIVDNVNVSEVEDITQSQYGSAQGYSTNTGGALNVAKDMLKDEGYQEHVIVLTDGIPNRYEMNGSIVGDGSETYEDIYPSAKYARDVAKEMGEEGVTIHTVGIDTSRNSNMISGIYAHGLNNEETPAIPTLFYDKELNKYYDWDTSLSEMLDENVDFKTATNNPRKVNGDLTYIQDEKANEDNSYNSDTYLERITADAFLSTYVSQNGGTNVIVENAALLKEDALSAVFSKIAEDISASSMVKANEIKDTIDPRFTMSDTQITNLVDEFYANNGGKTNPENKAVIENSTTWTADNGGTLQIINKEGDISIVWGGAAAWIAVDDGESNNQYDGWNYKIGITAKEDFMGGNVVPSNTSDSYVELDTGENIIHAEGFPEPYVNVDAAMENAESYKTVFIDEETGVKEFITRLAEESGVNVKDADILKELFVTGKVPYGYAGTAEELGTLTIQLYDENGDIIDLSKLDDEIGEKEGTVKYTAELSYTVNEVSERLEKYIDPSVVENNSSKEFFGTDPDYELKKKDTEALESKATFESTVIAGEINITKAVDEIINQKQAGDAIFQFKITKVDESAGDGTDSQKNWYRTVRIGEPNSTVETEAAKIIEGLPRGTYEIAELSVLRYDFESVSGNNPTDGTELVETYTVDGNNIRFVIECDTNFDFFMGSEVELTGFEKSAVEQEKNAYVLFTNQAIEKIAETDTDVVSNEFVYVNGAWTMSDDSATLGETQVGNYYGGQGPSNGYQN